MISEKTRIVIRLGGLIFIVTMLAGAMYTAADIKANMNHRLDTIEDRMATKADVRELAHLTELHCVALRKITREHSRGDEIDCSDFRKNLSAAESVLSQK